MTEREELLRRLERVKALAERGVGGEKENAEALLNRLMAKYGISEEDIEDTAERDYFIRYQFLGEKAHRTDCLQASWQRSLLRYGRHPIGTAAQEDLCDLYAGPVH